MKDYVSLIPNYKVSTPYNFKFRGDNPFDYYGSFIKVRFHQKTNSCRFKWSNLSLAVEKVPVPCMLPGYSLCEDVIISGPDALMRFVLVFLLRFAIDELDFISTFFSDSVCAYDVPLQGRAEIAFSLKNFSHSGCELSRPVKCCVLVVF